MTTKKKRGPSAEMLDIAKRVLGTSDPVTGRPRQQTRTHSLSASVIPPYIEGQLEDITKAIEHQRAKFFAEEAAFMLKAKTAMDDAANELARLLDAITVSEQEFRDAEVQSSNAHIRLNGLKNAAKKIAHKIAFADAAKAEAAAEIEKATSLRQQLEEALAALRAFPTAKVEAWAKKRQAMAPEALPRFTGIAG